MLSRVRGWSELTAIRASFVVVGVLTVGGEALGYLLDRTHHAEDLAAFAVVDSFAVILFAVILRTAGREGKRVSKLEVDERTKSITVVPDVLSRSLFAVYLWLPVFVVLLIPVGVIRRPAAAIGCGTLTFVALIVLVRRSLRIRLFADMNGLKAVNFFRTVHFRWDEVERITQGLWATLAVVTMDGRWISLQATGIARSGILVGRPEVRWMLEEAIRHGVYVHVGPDVWRRLKP